jgi:shikimate kinase
MIPALHFMCGKMAAGKSTLSKRPVEGRENH